MKYILSRTRYFRENGKTIFPGHEIDLPEDVANEINRNEGPTLKAAVNAQLVPGTVSAATRKAGKVPSNNKSRAKK